MHRQLEQDQAAFELILDRARQLAGDYLHELPHRPAAARQPVQPAMRTALPACGEGAMAVLERFKQEYSPLLSGSPGPRYFGFVTGGSTPAALAADWLVSTYDQNAQRNGDTCAATIEAQAVTCCANCCIGRKIGRACASPARRWPTTRDLRWLGSGTGTSAAVTWPQMACGA